MADRLQRYPQVLLLGNGAVFSKTGWNWNEMLDKISVQQEKCADLLMPMPLRAVYLSGDSVQSRLAANPEDFYGRLDDPVIADRLRRLLSAGFDEILTTNYSYEPEMACLGCSEISESKLRTLSRNMIPGARAETKYLLHTCSCVKFGNAEQHIWHIHGEARKPGSMVLGHYEYAFLLGRIISCLKDKGNEYERMQRAGQAVRMESWLDSFVLGDVYILGFGMDFSELDLWWLLNRKKRERAEHGIIRYYAPDFDSKDDGNRSAERQIQKEKEDLMEVLGVEIHRIRVPEGQYSEFYDSAVGEIEAEVRKARSGGQPQ